MSASAALTSTESTSFIVAHGTVWALVLYMASSRALHWVSDQKVLHAIQESGELERLTTIAYIRDMCTKLDVLAYAGVSIICFAPAYLAGEPTKMLCHIRTSVMPVGLMALASAQVAKTVVVSRVIGYEWKIRKQEKTRAAALKLSRGWSHFAAYCSYGSTILTLAVGTGFTPQLLEHTSPVLPAGYAWCMLAVHAPVMATALYLASTSLLMLSSHMLGSKAARRVADEATSEKSKRGRRRSLGLYSECAAAQSAAASSRLRSSSAMRFVTRILACCNLVTVVGASLVLVAIVLASRDLGSTAAYSTTCAFSLGGVLLLWGSFIATILILRRSEGRGVGSS